MTPRLLISRLRTLRLDDYREFAWQSRLQLLAVAAAALTFVVAPATGALPGLALSTYTAALYVGCAVIVFKGATQFLTAMSDGVRSQQVRAVFTTVERSVWLYVSLGLSVFSARRCPMAWSGSGSTPTRRWPAPPDVWSCTSYF